LELRKTESRTDHIHIINAEYVKTIAVVVGIVLLMVIFLLAAIMPRDPADFPVTPTPNSVTSYTQRVIDIPKDGIGVIVTIDGNIAFDVYADKWQEITFENKTFNGWGDSLPFLLISGAESGKMIQSQSFIAQESGMYRFLVEDVHTGSEVFINVVDAGK